MERIRQTLWIFLTCLLPFVATASGQTLTQIRDTVVNTDGSPFDGTVVITWNGSTGSNSGTSAPLSTSARIYSGALSVILVPTTTASSASFYQAVYYGTSGVITWSENWQVPPSSTALTLAMVRTSTTQGPGQSSGSGTPPPTVPSGGGQYATLPISINQVTSLSANLASINSAIASLVAQVNSLSNSIGSSLGTNAAFIDAESPAGTLDGSNNAFTIAQLPVSGSLTIFRNGLVQSIGIDYAINSQTITFLPNSIPRSTDTLTAYYRVSGTGATATFVDSEVPNGTVDGNNLIFTLAAAPLPAASLKLYKNGVLLNQDGDYTLTGANISFVSAGVTPQPGDALTAAYRH
jgi:hypothetical protein